MNYREERAARKALIISAGAVNLIFSNHSTNASTFPEQYIHYYATFQSENLHFQKIVLLLEIG